MCNNITYTSINNNRFEFFITLIIALESLYQGYYNNLLYLVFLHRLTKLFVLDLDWLKIK